MPQRRSDIVDAASPGVYHCISRCVRREGLLRPVQRKQWIVERLEFLASLMAVDVVSFAVMDNHVHLLLRIRPEIVRTWSDREVAERRLALLVNRKARKRAGIAPGSPPTDGEVRAILGTPRLLRRAREDLSSLGFFHRLLKEPCARAWNREDGVTGHFWEGRFLSPRVLDPEALLRVSRYVELNEVRAGVAKSLPSSVWTSARRQWERLTAAMREWLCDPSEPVELHLDRVEWRPVFPCKSGRGLADEVPLERCPNPCVPLTEYLTALESAGRIAHPRKPGRLRDLTSAISRAAQAASVGTSGLAGELLSGWAGKFEERLREELVAKVIGHDGASELRRLAGSCYGSPESIALEAARRGVRRVLSVPMVG